MSVYKSKKNLLITAIVPLLLIATISAVSFASSVSITSTNVYAINGINYQVTGQSGFTVENQGFSIVRTGSVTDSPKAWSTGGSIKTATTTGDWQLTLKITANAVKNGGTVSVAFNTGSVSTYTLSWTGSTAADEYMTFVFDVGTTIDTSTTMVVTIT